MIRNFSLRQRLHLLLALLYGECDERMRQEIKCSILLSFRVQICLLSSVEFLCLAWQNDAVSIFRFEVILCESDVCFGCVVVFTCDGGLVDY